MTDDVTRCAICALIAASSKTLRSVTSSCAVEQRDAATGAAPVGPRFTTGLEEGDVGP